jgi:hypothetical protein
MRALFISLDHDSFFHLPFGLQEHPTSGFKTIEKYFPQQQSNRNHASEIAFGMSNMKSKNVPAAMHWQWRSGKTFDFTLSAKVA